MFDFLSTVVKKKILLEKKYENGFLNLCYLQSVVIFWTTMEFCISVFWISEGAKFKQIPTYTLDLLSQISFASNKFKVFFVSHHMNGQTYKFSVSA